MSDSVSSLFFRLLYRNLGSLSLLGLLRSLAWIPLLLWISLRPPSSMTLPSYGITCLGFLLIPLFLDPWIQNAGQQRSLAIARGRPIPGLLQGADRNYAKLWLWHFLQFLFLALLLFNTSLLFTAIPGLLLVIAAELSFWVWLILRGMNLHMPRLLEVQSFRAAFLESLKLLIARPGAHFLALVFRFGLSLILLASGIGALLWLGSFGLLHAS
ncbi:MAG: hypothetical protein QGG80_08205, partial [Candidatus Krumholzibacteria bacterium]|nr:hypothetical protein [Candidatus Krumholzibacteria bacterium]